MAAYRCTPPSKSHRVAPDRVGEQESAVGAVVDLAEVQNGCAVERLSRRDAERILPEFDRRPPVETAGIALADP